MNHPMLAPSRSANVSSRKPFGKQAGLVSVLAPLALAGSTLCFAANPARAITSFAGNYDPANWTQSVQGNGSIDTSNAPVSIMLNGPDDGSGNAQSVDFTIAAPAAGTVLFDWVYSTDDDAPGQDPFGFVLNGSFIQLSSDTGDSYQSDTAAFTVIAGDVFGFRQRTNDSRFGSASTTISDFNFVTSAPPQSTVPGPLPLIGAGAAWGWSRRLRQRIATPVTTAHQA